MFTTD